MTESLSYQDRIATDENFFYTEGEDNSKRYSYTCGMIVNEFNYLKMDPKKLISPGAMPLFEKATEFCSQLGRKPRAPLTPEEAFKRISGDEKFKKRLRGGGQADTSKTSCALISSDYELLSSGMVQLADPGQLQDYEQARRYCEAAHGGLSPASTEKARN